MFKRLIFSYLVLAGSCFEAFAQTTPSWLRYAAISPNSKTIVFTYKGDLYQVPATGGTAMPLTLHEAHDFMPVWSHDGKSLVFASDRYGNFDLFRIPATGGEAKRLTFHSAPEYPYAFSPDDKTVYFGSARLDIASNRQFPTAYQPELYKVGVNGGQVQQVLTTPAEDVTWSKDGQVMLYHDKKGGENAWRKHHVSSVARDIWMYDAKNGIHTQLTTYAGEDRNPVFADNEKTIYYLSEANGTFNVYKMAAQGPAVPTAVTNFAKHPVRFLSIANNGTLCFTQNGNIYTKTATSEPQKLSITISTEAKIIMSAL